MSEDLKENLYNAYGARRVMKEMNPSTEGCSHLTTRLLMQIHDIDVVVCLMCGEIFEELPLRGDKEDYYAR
jgi:hypothetical protein